jgi:hypothetical protein
MLVLVFESNKYELIRMLWIRIHFSRIQIHNFFFLFGFGSELFFGFGSSQNIRIISNSDPQHWDPQHCTGTVCNNMSRNIFHLVDGWSTTGSCAAASAAGNVSLRTICRGFFPPGPRADFSIADFCMSTNKENHLRSYFFMLEKTKEKQKSICKEYPVP